MNCELLCHFQAFYDFLVMLPNVNPATCLVSLACLTALIAAKIMNGHRKVMKILRFPIPMELCVVSAVISSLHLHTVTKHEQAPRQTDSKSDRQADKWAARQACR